jgi:hypothetical protein
MIVAIPVAIATFAVTVHPPIPIRRTIITVVAICGAVIVITIIAIFRSQIAPDRSIVTAPLILVTQLIWWLRSALRLYRSGLRLGGDRCLSSVFGERGNASSQQHYRGYGEDAHVGSPTLPHKLMEPGFGVAVKIALRSPRSWERLTILRISFRRLVDKRPVSISGG